MSRKPRRSRSRVAKTTNRAAAKKVPMAKASSNSKSKTVNSNKIKTVNLTSSNSKKSGRKANFVAGVFTEKTGALRQLTVQRQVDLRLNRAGSYGPPQPY